MSKNFFRFAMDVVIVTIGMVVMAWLISAAFSKQAHAGGMEQKPPASTVSSNSASSSSAAAIAGAAAISGSSAKGGNASSNASGGAGGEGGSSTQAQKQSQGNGNSQSTSTYVAPNVPGLMLPTQIIAGCQVAGAAGGANTRAAGMMGIEFTPDECYSYIDAQANLAIGDYQTACEILHVNRTTKRARDRGAKIADCALLVPHVVEKIVEVHVGPTEVEIQGRIDAAVLTYANLHPVPACAVKKKRKVAAHMECAPKVASAR